MWPVLLALAATDSMTAIRNVVLDVPLHGPVKPNMSEHWNNVEVKSLLQKIDQLF